MVITNFKYSTQLALMKTNNLQRISRQKSNLQKDNYYKISYRQQNKYHQKSNSTQ